MTETLSSEGLQVRVSADGAELISVRSRMDGSEYIWQADPAVWGRHAPVLFPIVGMLNKNRLRVEGREFELSQHGFARDSRFKLVSQDKNRLTYELCDSPETRLRYPFSFRLSITYRLEGNRLSITYRVNNPTEVPLWFSIGAHPGFRCPLEPGLDLSGHQIRFEKPEVAERLLLQDGLLSGQRRPFLEGTDQLPITRDLFKEGALVFDSLQSRWISYQSRSGRRSVTVEFEGFPYLGIWSKPEVPFVCIEPWYGVADRVGAKWEFADKPGVIQLSAGQEFSCRHHLRFD